MINAWHADPSPAGIRQSWSAAQGSAGGSNFTGYASRAFDALVDSAASATSPAAGQALYARAYDLLADDAPAVWLYEARNFAGLHRRVHPVGMRADAWWAHLAEWTIPSGERIPRDRIGLRAAAP
jgi:peptide/nickel transport system substrate-binding protein